MFRWKSGINVSYNRQGYIYFTSLLYSELPKKDKDRILQLCRDTGGEYSDALFAFVTTGANATSICMRYYVTKSTLYRIVKKYYEAFPKNL